MVGTKLLLVGSSPLKKEVKIKGKIYIKSRTWNRRLYILKLLLIIGPLLAQLMYYLYFAKEQDSSLAPVIYLLTLFLAITIINFVVPDDILEKINY